MSEWQPDWDEADIIPVEYFSYENTLITNEQELGIGLLKRYGNGPLGAYDVITTFNFANGCYEFYPAYVCDYWVIQGKPPKDES